MQPTSGETTLPRNPNGADCPLHLHPQYYEYVLQQFRDIGAVNPQPIFIDLTPHGAVGHIVCNRIDNIFYHQVVDPVTGATYVVPVHLGHFLVPQFFHPRPLIEYVVTLPPTHGKHPHTRGKHPHTHSNDPTTHGKHPGTHSNEPGTHDKNQTVTVTEPQPHPQPSM